MLRLYSLSAWKMYLTDPKASTLCLLLIRYKSRVKYDERATNKGLLKESKFHLRHLPQKNLYISRPLICQAHEIEHWTACHNCFVENFLFPFLLFYETYTTYRGIKTDIHTMSEGASKLNQFDNLYDKDRWNNIDKLVGNNKSASKLRQGIYYATC